MYYRLNVMWAVLISGQQTLETDAPRQAEDQNIGLCLCFCLATACMGHVAVGQTSPTVMKGMFSLFQGHWTQAPLCIYSIVLLYIISVCFSVLTGRSCTTFMRLVKNKKYIHSMT